MGIDKINNPYVSDKWYFLKTENFVKLFKFQLLSGAS